jgi:protein kinase-like protein
VTTEITFTGESGAAWRYWTDRPLGTPGTFGAVYEAESKDGTPMAVKVVAKHRPGWTLDERLLRREIEIGRQVSDGGSTMLLPVIDAADDGKAFLLVMIRAEKPLAAVPIPMTESEAIAVMTDIATGLRDLHSAWILHRDLKPANVLRHDRHWKLADFGIARDEAIGTQDPTFTMPGTPLYMAPEVWNLDRLTIKTDLYALGCLSFELLAGSPPYTGDLGAVRAGHLSQAPPEVPCRNVKLKNLIARLIAKDPASRPQDAQAVMERLSLAQLAQPPVLEAIGRGLGRHDAEKARAAAEKATAEAAAAARRQLIEQAKADLREILSDAVEDLQLIEPDVWLEERGTTRLSFVAAPSLGISTAAVRLRIDLWEGMTTDKPVAGDTMVLAGCVMITNPRHPKELNAANVVYEQVGDRLGWQVYRFSGMALAGRYPYGPFSRTHGLQHGVFFDARERYAMIHPVGFHAWTNKVVLLTAESALELFREAVDLQPPDPRTGLYPASP